MANSNLAMFPQLIKTSAVTIVAADTTTKKSIITAGAQGAKITGLTHACDDTATLDCLLYITIGGTDYLIGEKIIPATSGFVTAIAAYNWFDGIGIPGLPIDRDGQRYILLPAAGLLKIAAKATVTANKTHYITAIGSDF